MSSALSSNLVGKPALSGPEAGPGREHQGFRVTGCMEQFATGTCGLKCSLWLTQSETWDSLGSLGFTGVHEAPINHGSGSCLGRGSILLVDSSFLLNAKCDRSVISQHLYCGPSLSF